MTAITKASLATAILLLSLSVYVHFTIGFWGDQDWELLAARMLLSGKALYIQDFTLLPPLIFYLYTLPVALSLHLAFLQDFQALVLLGICSVALTIALCTRLISEHPAFTGNRNRQTWFVMLLCFLFIFRIAPSYFADREHIFLVLTFPYLLRWMPSLSAVRLSLRLRLLIGSMAAIGFFIKPHCLIFFIGLQLICLLRKDRPRIIGSIENRVIYGTGLLYLLAIVLFTPEYFTTILPMALLTYSVISAGPDTLFDYTLLITAALTFVMFRLRYTSPYRQDIYYLTLASVFLLVYALVNNGWGYTYQPVITLLLFVNAFVLWEFLYLREDYASMELPSWKFLIGAGTCSLNFVGKLAIAPMYFYLVLSHSCHGDIACPGYYMPFVQEVSASPQPHSFGMIGMNFALWTRVSKLSGAEWVTRFPQLWMIPKFLISDENFNTKHQWILYYVAGALAEDLEKNKPETVFVDVSDTIYTIRFKKPLDWIASFSIFLNFKEAWQHYTYVHTLDSCNAVEPALEVGLAMMNRAPVAKSNCRFDVYRRIH